MCVILCLCVESCSLQVWSSREVQFSTLCDIVCQKRVVVYKCGVGARESSRTIDRVSVFYIVCVCLEKVVV